MTEGFGRRTFLKQVATVAGIARLPVTVTGATGVAAQQAEAAPAVSLASKPAPGYQSLSPDEAAFVEALVNVMCPADDLTPAGVDCGLAVYIDRQLAGGFGKGERLYMRGPWRPGKPELGYQLPLTPEQYFKAGIATTNEACSKRFAKAFDALPQRDADAFLQDLAAGKLTDPRFELARWFNELVYPLFVQACFADPIYGGNNDKVFWRMIGLPGLPATHTRNMVDFRGKPFPSASDPKSIADFS
jgi:gluconate 2-dehydrogenase gamma chain